MKTLITALVISLSSALAGAQHITPAAMYVSSDGTGNAGTWAAESGTGSTGILPSTPPLQIGAYCSNDGTGNAGTWVPCSAGGGGAVSAVSNSDGTLTITPTTGAVVASLALGHGNTWTGAQNFGANTTQAPNTSMSSTAAGFAAWTLSAHSDTGNAILNLTTVGNAAIISMTHNLASTQALSMGNNDSGIQFSDAAATDLNVAASTGQAIRLGAGFGSASTLQVTSSNVTIPSIKSTTGTRFVCADTSGNLVSSVTACSGT